MKKNAIIELIESDLREMLTLVGTFKDADRIGKDFIALLAEKNSGIGREVNLLNFWASEGIQKQERVVELVADIAATPVRHEEVRPKEPVPAKVDEPQAPVAPVVEDAVPEPPIAPLVLEESEDDLFEFEKPKVDEAPEAKAPVIEAAPAEPEISFVPPRDEAAHEDPRPAQPSASVATTPREEAPLVRRSAADIANYGTPVADINRALSLNDRFLFRRELFGGDQASMEQVLIAINAANSYDEAHYMLKSNFHWDETDPTVEAFLKAVHRRFL